MQVIQNNLDAVNANLLVKIEPADYNEKVEKAVKNFRKKANVPGFRPGTVPASLIKKMYGKGILADEVNNLISESLYNYISENKLEILGEPLPTEGFTTPDLKEGETFEFSFDIALAPEIKAELKNLTYYTINITDDLVEKQTKAFKGRFSRFEQANDVQEGDVVKLTVQELNADGSVKEGGISVDDAMLSPKFIKNEDERAKLIGLKVDESCTFNLKAAHGEGSEAEIASFLKISKEDAEKFASDCKLTVKSVSRTVEPAMDQEFFDQCFGKDNVKSEAEFTEKIKSELSAQFVSDSDIKFLIDARNQVIDQTKDVVFPDAFLKRWLAATNKEMKAEEIETEYPKMCNDLRWQLFKDNLAKANDVKIEADDIKAVAAEAAKNQFAQYGMIGVPQEIIDGYVADMLKDKKAHQRMAERAGEIKLIAIIKDQTKPETKGVSFEEFSKFFEQA